MARMADIRSKYEGAAVSTTPERLITMLYDRLVRDLTGAEEAIRVGARDLSNEQLVHAQEIVFELLSALDESKPWAGAAALSSLYTWLLGELVQANLQQDALRVATCRELVEPLAQAWHLAEAEVANSRMGTAV
jgi:flagellar protein FliS